MFAPLEYNRIYGTLKCDFHMIAANLVYSDSALNDMLFQMLS